MRAAYSSVLAVTILASIAEASRAAVHRHKHHRVARTTAKSPIPYSSVQLSPETIDLVDQVLSVAATHSWEIGTRETALLELKSPKYFLYDSSSSIPPPALTSSEDIDDISECFDSVDSVLAKKPAGIETFFKDGAVGDPASVGIPFLIRIATGGSSLSSNYSIATDQELNHLLNVQRENSTGAISQREPPEPVQIWADFVGMAPPFISYYGAINNNQSLVQLGYDQVADYRTLLLDSSVGLLQHIVLSGGSGTAAQDHGHWGTGNSWFVMGLLRVERIIALSQYARQMAQQRTTLLQWALEITNAAWSYQANTGALYNYIDCVALGNANTTKCFEDSAGTALMAANTFRLAQILYSDEACTSTLDVGGKILFPNLLAAERAREYIVNHVNTTTGIVWPIVNPLNWAVELAEGGTSPEGEAFVLLLQAAYQDWWSLTKGRY
ncbi:hypothetical protein DL93DRAFT_2077103 [Clavulina sp. PMI_390]|nr:hypothetical protein DL93DRAFT_2077103 [Clavulina sp. PMI_390]